MVSTFRRRITVWAHDGRLYAVLAAAGFSLKAVFVKLAYAAGPVDALTLLACLGYYLSSLFDFQGLAYITAGLERLILYLYPTIVLLLQVWLTRRKPEGRVWRALGICYLGLAIAFAHDLDQSGHGIKVLTGAVWVFASAVTYALYYLGTGDMVERIGSMRLTGLAMFGVTRLKPAARNPVKISSVAVAPVAVNE